MDTKLKAQLYDIISLATTEESSELVDMGNIRIRKEDVEEYQKLQKQIDIIKPENQESPLTNFPGTDIPKPRFRNYDESDEEYVQFLQEYYSVYFPKAKSQTSKKEQENSFSLLYNLDGEELKRDSLEMEALEHDDSIINDIPGEEITNNEFVENTEEFETESPLMLLDGEELEKPFLEDENLMDDELVHEDLDSKNETEVEMEPTDEELEEMYDDMMRNLGEAELEDENFDVLEESEIVSIKNIPKKLWEKIKSIPFIGKAIRYLENLVAKNKKVKKEEPDKIESETIDEDKEQQKDVIAEPVKHRASDEDLKNDAKSTFTDDYHVEDAIDKIIINGVEPLTSAFTTTGELFNKVDNGTAYDYSDLERARIENVRDTINPEMNGFFISKIIKQNDDGSIENVQSARPNDLEHLIFEVSNKDIPDYVFARYSGKNIKESLVSQDKISSKAM